MQPALALGRFLPPPAAGALVLAGTHGARARLAADRDETLVVQGVVRHAVVAKVFPDLGERRVEQRPRGAYQEAIIDLASSVGVHWANVWPSSAFTRVVARFIGAGWDVNRARKTTLLICALSVVPVFFAPFAGTVWLAVLIVGLAGSAHQAWSANLFTTVSDMFPKRAVASVTGLGGLAGAFCGIYFPIYCGKILDKFKAADNVTGGYAILFSICAFAYLVTFAIHHVLAPKFEQIQFKEKAA